MKVEVFVFVACAAACLVAHVAILRSVVRSRSAAPDAAVPRPRLVAEILWALIPALVLAFVLTATWARVRDGTGTPRPGLIMRIAR